jgi:Na+-driven multidrug efflux pump
MMLTDVAFLGHYGSQYLAAASLASVWQALTWIIIQQGICSALSTLCAQVS